MENEAKNSEQKKPKSWGELFADLRPILMSTESERKERWLLATRRESWWHAPAWAAGWLAGKVFYGVRWVVEDLWDHIVWGFKRSRGF